MVLLLFRELNFHSRFINRAAGNVLAVYVLDGTVQTFLLKWIDFKPYAGSWFLVFLAIGYALAIMIIACLLNEVRKATNWTTGALARECGQCRGDVGCECGKRCCPKTTHVFLLVDFLLKVTKSTGFRLVEKRAFLHSCG